MLRVWDPDSDGVVVKLAVCDSLGVDVGDIVRVRLTVWVCDGVLECVMETDCVCDSVGVSVELAVAVCELVRVSVPLDVIVCEPVGDAVQLGVWDRLGVRVTDWLADSDCDPEDDSESSEATGSGRSTTTAVATTMMRARRVIARWAASEVAEKLQQA